jgi:hypothetical protein
MLLRSVPPPGTPRLPNPRTLKIGVLIVLALAYGALFVVLSRHPKAPSGPRYTAIPVAVVKTARHDASPPAPAVHLASPAPVDIPPPRLTIH